MKTVHKYYLQVGDLITLDLPAGAQCLHVGTQRDVPHLWALVDSDARKVERCFRLAGTGHVISERIKAHVGTFMLDDGALVFHLFEVEP